MAVRCSSATTRLLWQLSILTSNMVWTLINQKPLGILYPVNFCLIINASYSSIYLCSSLFESIHFALSFFLSSFCAFLKFLGTSKLYLYRSDIQKDFSPAYFSSLSVNFNLFANLASFFHPSSSRRPFFGIDGKINGYVSVQCLKVFSRDSTGFPHHLDFNLVFNTSLS